MHVQRSALAQARGVGHEPAQNREKSSRKIARLGLYGPAGNLPRSLRRSSHTFEPIDVPVHKARFSRLAPPTCQARVSLSQ